MPTAVTTMLDAIEADAIEVAADWARYIYRNCGWQLQAVPEVWTSFSNLCPGRIKVSPLKGQNALRIEVGAWPADRCMRRSPDGRGPVGRWRGGEACAEGRCERTAGPLLRKGEE